MGKKRAGERRRTLDIYWFILRNSAMSLSKTNTNARFNGEQQSV
ncbi:MAG: hypothetical protein ABSB74_12785 [Tepidisphaeraceae bacterium]